MTLPALSQFLAYPPGFPLKTPILEVFRTLSHIHEAPCSHLIIVDTHQRPTGALSVRQLWGYDPTTQPQATLDALSPWVEPIVQVSAQQSIQAIWPLPPPDTAPPVVVVDASMRYVGVVNPLTVLAWLAGEIQFGAEDLILKTSPAGSLPQRSEDHQGWLLEISHALKNPMTSLLGLSTLLLDHRVGSLTDRQTRYAFLIQQVVRKLISMVNQLLDWMRLDANQLSFDVEILSLQPFAHQVISSYLAQLPSPQDQDPWVENFALDLPPEPLGVRADPLRLQQSVHWILDYLLLHQVEPAGLEINHWGAWLGITLWTLGPPIEPLNSLTAWDQPLPRRARAHSPGLLDSLGVLLARRCCQMQGGDLTYHVSDAGNRITLLLSPAPLDGTGDGGQTLSTVLVLMVCLKPELVDQVYLQLQGSPYRLALARSAVEAEAMIQRLSPAYVISPAGFLPDLEAALRVMAAGLSPGDKLPVLIQLASGVEAVDQHPRGAAHRVTLQTLKPTLDRLASSPPVTENQPPILPGLTILLLPPQTAAVGEPLQVGLTADLRAWLQHYQCRLLQVDDLQQANVISRVWQPDAVLLDSEQAISREYWQALAQVSELAALPLITLTPCQTQWIAQDYGLKVWACPVFSHSPQMGAISLIQAIANALEG